MFEGGVETGKGPGFGLRSAVSGLSDRSSRLNTYLLVGAGGAAGALARFWLSQVSYQRLGHDFPYGTLIVNVAGSLIIGFLYFWLIRRFSIDTELRGLLIIGFLGAFTTFSAFSLETVILLEQGAWLKGAIYVGLSVTLCVLASGAGMLVARAF